MSVLIKGLAMPQNCVECPLNYDGYCGGVKEEGGEIDRIEWRKNRMGFCPLIQLPDHGDLVDAQMLDADLRKMIGRAMKKAEAEGCEDESYFVGRASAFVDARRLLNDWKRAVVIPAERNEE